MYSRFYDGDDDFIARRRERTRARKLRRKASKARKKAVAAGKLANASNAEDEEEEPGYGFGV